MNVDRWALKTDIVWCKRYSDERRKSDCDSGFFPGSGERRRRTKGPNSVIFWVCLSLSLAHLLMHLSYIANCLYSCIFCPITFVVWLCHPCVSLCILVYISSYTSLLGYISLFILHILAHIILYIYLVRIIFKLVLIGIKFD